MTLVEFVDADAADAVELRVFEQHAQHDAFGDVGEASFAAGHILKAHLIADFAAELGISLTSDPLGQHACSNAAWLEHDAAFAFGQQAGVEHELRDLRGFAAASGRFDEQIRRRRIEQGGGEGLAEFEDRQRGGHAGVSLSSNAGMSTKKALGIIEAPAPACAHAASARTLHL